MLNVIANDIANAGPANANCYLFAVQKSFAIL